MAVRGGPPREQDLGLAEDLGQSRVVIEAVEPAVDGGRFPVKRIVGDRLTVEADIFADGHDRLAAALRIRAPGASEWSDVPMEHFDNDRWRAELTLQELGEYSYTVQAWCDAFETWREDLGKKVDAGQDVAVELLVGAALVERASRRAAADADQLRAWADTLRAEPATDNAVRIQLALGAELATVMDRNPDRTHATTYARELRVVVDRERARYGAWYEMFPRSCAAEPGAHGTFRDCEARLAYVAALGFDVVYLPPIHPIGHSHRKGKNNSPTAGPTDPGSPWGIGSEEGGHRAIHPQLGTLEDFRRFVERTRSYGMEVALDLAYQCSPDHPYVREHPEWFGWRPDGTIQYAENPPKKYQDIYPLNFQTEHWQDLWEELKSVVTYWIAQGVRIFRVDNPHTKPFAFWEWLIGDVKQRHPDVIFLAEAFTRPKVMHRLAKLGFTQSYTYFTWRNTKAEIVEYFTELTQNQSREYFRPNLWPNTPDILHAFLQEGGRPAFMIRLLLAATLGPNYGIYGPSFEQCANRPLAPGSEEYWDSEKYEIKYWDLDRAESLKDLVARLNQIRRENPALHTNAGLRFHPVDNDQIVAYSKSAPDGSNTVLVIVSLDPHHPQTGWLDLALDPPRSGSEQSYTVHDLLTDQRYHWHGSKNYVALDPSAVPAHVFRLEDE